MFNPTVAGSRCARTVGRKRALLFALPAVILIVLTLLLKASRTPLAAWPRTCSARSASPCCCR